MKMKKKIIFSIFCLLMIILFSNTLSYAGTQSWNALDYDVTLNEDGSMDIVETWDVVISETNTLFKDFELNDYDDYKIENPKISQVINGQEKFLKQIYEEQYHVDSGCYYGLQIDSDTYEIAWNVGLDNSTDTRIYKMYYTVENAVVIHEDCTELYWQFLSDENGMYGDNITGTIKLPKSVTNIDKLKVWGHGPLTAVINKDSTEKVSFSLDSIYSNQMLEVRVVTEENIYEKSTNFTNRYKLDEILSEEQTWADEANRKREESKNILKWIKIILILLVIINIFIFRAMLSKRKKYKEIGKELEEKYSFPQIDLQYFRDIPDERNATPARASYLYEFRKNYSNIQANISKIFSATMLDLSLKGFVKFETNEPKEVKIYVTSNDENKEEILTEDERIVLELLELVIEEKEFITVNEFSKYASKEYEIVYGKLKNIGKIVERDLKSLEKISEERKKIYEKWTSKFTINLFLTILVCFFGFLLPGLTIGLILLTAASSKNAKCVCILSEKGNEEEKQWKALKKYMEDYSMLDEKLVPDIILWEKYLVYATVFGISKKVIKQLKVVHPEMFYQENSSDLNRYAYWNMISHTTLGENYFNDFSKSLEKVYNNAQSAYNVAHSSSSSGSGGGGGFSGGGGGRRRRRKLRWSLN